MNHFLFVHPVLSVRGRNERHWWLSVHYSTYIGKLGAVLYTSWLLWTRRREGEEKKSQIYFPLPFPVQYFREASAPFLGKHILSSYCNHNVTKMGISSDLPQKNKVHLPYKRDLPNKHVSNKKKSAYVFRTWNWT